MRVLASLPRAVFSKTALLPAVLLLLIAPVAQSQTVYRPGDIVTTNISMQNRFRWTNDTGQIYAPSNATIRLHDFEGKIIFLLFFDVW
jgi:hypothetical protein